MTGKTHWGLGVMSGVAVAGLDSVHGDAVATVLTVVVATLASILPDIDDEGSVVNKFLFQGVRKSWRSFALAFVGVAIMLFSLFYQAPLWVLLAGLFALSVAFVPHRSFTHSLLALAAVAGITYLASPVLVPAMVAGYASHLLADSLTPAGVPLLWPLSVRIGFGRIGLHFPTGGWGDRVLGRLSLWMASLMCVWFLFDGLFVEGTWAMSWIESVLSYF
ncbi:metal-dependent hydrolase [Mechercharimyces sp. CAU 1602]|uniref:metal-dependent hydrolase n=1 Tax=Mechercharimyces sp. CAU 1602 TaxID=2973933 RepID=UPI0021628734|nr:metal-dependent hydrolase [Mechercharimyces sp. CAU 1602]MCS1351573.1 metal-dependent hydrolase [Mechercharimyces sp. CAU 1602]